VVDYRLPMTDCRCHLSAHDGILGPGGTAVKKELRMNAKSPDPDDLSSKDLPEPAAEKEDGDPRKKSPQRPNPDRSAPHIPPADE
jgi:hypothetical protein